jgi:hypothetical protein
MENRQGLLGDEDEMDVMQGLYTDRAGCSSHSSLAGILFCLAMFTA